MEIVAQLVERQAEVCRCRFESGRPHNVADRVATVHRQNHGSREFKSQLQKDDELTIVVTLAGTTRAIS